MFGRGTRKVTVRGFADAVTRGIRPEMTQVRLPPRGAEWLRVSRDNAKAQ